MSLLLRLKIEMTKLTYINFALSCVNGDGKLCYRAVQVTRRTKARNDVAAAVVVSSVDFVLCLLICMGRWAMPPVLYLSYFPVFVRLLIRYRVYNKFSFYVIGDYDVVLFQWSLAAFFNWQKMPLQYTAKVLVISTGDCCSNNGCMLLKWCVMPRVTTSVRFCFRQDFELYYTTRVLCLPCMTFTHAGPSSWLVHVDSAVSATSVSNYIIPMIT